MDSRPDGLLLPGFMLDKRLWRQVLPDLNTLWHVHHAEISHEASVDQIAQSVLASAPEKFVLCGFSLGGIVAQTIAVLAPQRVQGLVLINTTSGPATDAEIKRYQGQITLAKPNPFKGLTRRSLQTSLSPINKDNDALLQEMQSMALRQGKDALINGLEALKTRPYVNLQQISCPTCVITAEDDTLFSMKSSQEIVQRIPDAELHVIPNSGHMTPLEQPTLLANAIKQWCITHTFR